MPPSPSQRIIDNDDTFFSGVKSDVAPGQVPLGYTWMTINTLNIGGLISCRPGYRCVIALPDGNLQGGFIYQPQEGIEQAVVVVDGIVYIADYPFTNFNALPGIQLSPYARQVYFCQTLQAAERDDATFTSAITVIPPKAVLFIQDGGLSAPVWYDGHNSGQLSGIAYATPSGGVMAWVGSRLWVASGSQVFASDISNPFSFRESDYLGGQVSFFFRAPVTAMIVTPSIESPQLMVFTEIDGSILQANITDRTQWTSTLNFQEEVIGVGCPSARGVASHYGQLVFFSSEGVSFFDPSLSGKITTRLPVRDNEMMVSKATVSDDLSTVAVGTYGQFLLASVPAEDSYNAHTWVLNHASMTTLSDDSGPSWAGYWIGTRPVQWMGGNIANVDRIFYVSYDYDGKNRLWEAFTPDRMDNRCPITWAIFTRGMFGGTSALQSKPPGTRCRLQWADIGLAAIEEDLNVGVFYAGGVRGAFRQIMSKLVNVDRGCLSYDQIYTADSQIFAYKAQSRTLRTEDANQTAPSDYDGACSVESADQDNIDIDFQLLIVGQGPATLRRIRPFSLLVPEDLSGSGDACSDEKGDRAVRFDGVGVNQDNETDSLAALSAISVADYTSQQTVVLNEGGFSAVGVGSGESIISQEAADRVATVVATRMAEMELASLLPPVLSTGLDLPPIFYTPTDVAIPPVTPPTPGSDIAKCPVTLFAPLPDAVRTVAYSQQVVSAWGPSPLSFSISAGALPSGLSMSGSGLITGTPITEGPFYFSIQATNNSGQTCVQADSIVVDAAPPPNWGSLSWATTVSGPNTVAVASGDTLQYSAEGSNPSGFPGSSGVESVVTAVGTLSYVGDQASCQITISTSADGNQQFPVFPQPSFPAPCSFDITVTQDGTTIFTQSTSTPNNPSGTVEIPFTIEATASSTIVVTVTATSTPGTSGFSTTVAQPIAGALEVSNV